MEDFMDFGEGVEPLGELSARKTAFHAAVEFVAQGTWKAGDFSVSCHGRR
jgi:hypothetical protein